MAEQKFEIILSPDLDITSTDFISVWNTNPKSLNCAEARLSSAKGTSFEPFTIAIVLITIGTGVATNIISELIKNTIQDIREKRKHQQQLADGAVHQKVQIEQIDKSDGTHSLRVDIEQ